MKNLETVKLLVAEGADLFAKNGNKNIPMLSFAGEASPDFKESQDLEIFKFLADKYNKTEFDWMTKGEHYSGDKLTIGGLILKTIQEDNSLKCAASDEVLARLKKLGNDWENDKALINMDEEDKKEFEKA
eukprot:CAMPEP_0119526468 /NCGR_PEP_ID=MMETSP1344-20130328/41086_1 /TAXON_ID=236787 /ORGANISM="Florenciella parvula, Strain CCMP2471" /LENGTH=129 /DNA_ID=CAMNT_0007565471 /DNA_START=65 /DNA_END=450 /DNA_ORIENTATION=-